MWNSESKMCRVEATNNPQKLLCGPQCGSFSGPSSLWDGKPRLWGSGGHLLLVTTSPQVTSQM